jgi:cobalt-zinc-cadmium efflux system outer membrane protein
VIPIALSEVLALSRINHDVGMAQSMAKAAQGDVIAADRSPFPVLTSKASSMDLQNGLGPGSLFYDKRIDKSLGIDWTWERGNKRTLRTQTAKALAQSSNLDVQETVIVQQILALNAFFDLFAAQSRADEIIQIAESYVKTSQTAQIRLKTGDISAQEAARISIEYQRALTDVNSAQLERQKAALVLAQLTNMQGSPLSWRVQQSWAELGAMSPSETQRDATASVVAALDDAVDQRSDVISAKTKVDASRAYVELVQSQNKADITWGASFDHYPGTSNRLLELRLQVPIQWSYGFEGELARAQAQLEQSIGQLEKTRLQAKTEILSLYQDVLISAQRNASYVQTIIPQADAVLKQAEFAYSKGALSLTDLLDARRTYRATRIDAIGVHSELAKAVGIWKLRTQAPTMSLDVKHSSAAALKD